GLHLGELHHHEHQGEAPSLRRIGAVISLDVAAHLGELPYHVWLQLVRCGCIVENCRPQPCPRRQLVAQVRGQRVSIGGLHQQGQRQAQVEDFHRIQGQLWRRLDNRRVLCATRSVYAVVIAIISFHQRTRGKAQKLLEAGGHGETLRREGIPVRGRGLLDTPPVRVQQLARLLTLAFLL